MFGKGISNSAGFPLRESAQWVRAIREHGRDARRSMKKPASLPVANLALRPFTNDQADSILLK